MRCKNIRFTADLPITSPDENGANYDLTAIYKATSSLVNAPIVMRDGDREVVVGIVTEATHDDQTIYVSGRLFYSGTQEVVQISPDGIVTNLEFQAFGICE